MRTAAGFGVELYREAGEVLVSYALAGLVIGILVGYLADRRVDAVTDNGIAVVLGSYKGLVQSDIINRLVCTSVTVLQLLCLCAVGKSHKLVTETDTECGDIQLDDILQVINNVNILGGISGAV